MKPLPTLLASGPPSFVIYFTYGFYLVAFLVGVMACLWVAHATLPRPHSQGARRHTGIGLAVALAALLCGCLAALGTRRIIGGP